VGPDAQVAARSRRFGHFGQTNGFELRRETTVKFRTLFLAGCAALLSTVPFAANAAAPMGFAGTAGVGYGSSDDTDTWTIGGSGAFGFNPTFGGQLDLSYNSIEDADGFGIGGSLFWAPAMGRVGGTLQSASFDDAGVDISAFGYGIFGELYASDRFTIAGKAGGVTTEVDVLGSTGSESGFYGGAALLGYAMPNLAIQGDFVFAEPADDFSTSTFGINAEFLVSETMPISIFGGWSWTNIDIGGTEADGDGFMIGLRFYFGVSGPTLVDKHRNGTLGWAGSTNITGGL
jgi:hypothetical protein